MGLSLLARTAGSRPNRMPMTMEKATAMMLAGMLLAEGVPMVRLSIFASPMPAPTPMRPPRLVSTTASVKNCHRMRRRFEGFRDEFRKHGIELGEDRIIKTPRVREVLDESKQAIRYLISSGFAFDGVFAISDWRALGAYLSLTEMGIRVPEDVRIIGYDGVSVATRLILNITSIQQDTRLIASNACDLLIRQMNRQPIENRRIVVPTSILNGQTI